MSRAADCIASSIRFAKAKPTEWQRVGNQIDAGINVFLTLFRPDLINAIAKAARKSPQLFWGEQPPFIPSVWGAVIS